MSIFFTWENGKWFSGRLLLFCVLVLMRRSMLFAETWAETAVSALRSDMADVRLEEEDFRLPAGAGLPLTLPVVERLFDQPLQAIPSTSAFLDDLERGETLSSYARLAQTLLGTAPRAAAGPVSNRPVDPTLPAPLQQALPPLVRALNEAQPLLKKAVRSVPPAARREFLAMNEWPETRSGALRDDISAHRTIRCLAAMQRFQERSLMEASSRLLAAIDEALPWLLQPWNVSSRVRIPTRAGDILIAGAEDDRYTDDDLASVALLIDAGGHNTYDGRPALALERQIRVVIDGGPSMTVTAPAGRAGGAGTGIFGIGAFIAPRAGGLKEITTGSFSQGAGLGGVGILWLTGPVNVNAQRFAQGAATFGVGLLRSDGAAHSFYTAAQSAQGYGATRGVGLFRHSGEGAAIKGGLVDPDPREPNGSVSLCQGVGVGPRAYAGGGVGLAVVQGSSTTVLASYFAQGAGYWHGLGGFRYRGNGSTLQTRRYAMGSGVHYAFGHFEALGDANRFLNWGVGPSYGWDHAGGSSLLIGDNNEVQVDWGAGTASIGSTSVSYWRLTHSRLKLCDHGGSSFFRDEPAYSIQHLEGEGNRLQCQGAADASASGRRRLRSPWGVFHRKGGRFDETLTFDPPVWPPLPQAATLERERVNLQAQLAASRDRSTSARKRVSTLVDIAAAFSLDRDSPREAFDDLLRLPAREAVELVEVLEPAALDQLIQLSILIPAHGAVVAEKILRRLDRFPLRKQLILLNFLRMSRPSLVADALLKRMDRHPKNNPAALATIRALASLMNKSSGQEPGARAVMEALSKASSSPLIPRMTVGAAFGLLATLVDLSAEERAHFFDAAPADVTSTLDEKGAARFVEILEKNKEAVQTRLQIERDVLATREPPVRSKAVSLLASEAPATVAGAIIALGHIAHPADAPTVAPFLDHTSAPVREAAAVALARMGAVSVLSEVLEEGSARTRATVMAGLSQATDPPVLALLHRAWNDPDVSVRLTALATVNTLAADLQSLRAELIQNARRHLDNDPNPDIAQALAFLDPPQRP